MIGTRSASTGQILPKRGHENGCRDHGHSDSPHRVRTYRRGDRSRRHSASQRCRHRRRRSLARSHKRGRLPRPLRHDRDGRHAQLRPRGLDRSRETAPLVPKPAVSAPLISSPRTDGSRPIQQRIAGGAGTCSCSDATASERGRSARAPDARGQHRGRARRAHGRSADELSRRLRRWQAPGERSRRYPANRDSGCGPLRCSGWRGARTRWSPEDGAMTGPACPGHDGVERSSSLAIAGSSGCLAWSIGWGSLVVVA